MIDLTACEQIAANTQTNQFNVVLKVLFVHRSTTLTTTHVTSEMTLVHVLPQVVAVIEILSTKLAEWVTCKFAIDEILTTRKPQRQYTKASRAYGALRCMLRKLLKAIQTNLGNKNRTMLNTNLTILIISPLLVETNRERTK